MNPRPAPPFAGKGLQCQYAQGREVSATVAQCRFMRRRPLALPDVELLVEGRRDVLLATCQQDAKDQTRNKPHTLKNP
jgi:hypothetical protein